MKLNLKLPGMPRMPKLPKFPKLKGKKIEANTRRMTRESAGELDEPNMKLSSAFIIVLVLHVVAVGGIYAFNSIKSNRAPAVDPTYRPSSAKSAAASRSDEDATGTVVPAAMTGTAPAPVPRVRRVRSGETLSQIASEAGVTVTDLEVENGLKSGAPLRAGQELRMPSDAGNSRPAERKTVAAKSSAAVRDSADTYTVVKGDNPVAIARKFGVSYSDLLKLNNIDDPRKMQIGRKLHIPPKSKSH